MATPSDTIIRVLLVDDDEDDYILTRDLLSEIAGHRFELTWRHDFDTGLEGICSNDYDIVLLDFKLGKRTGMDLLTEARRLNCETPVIMLTGLSDPQIDLAVMKHGAAQYLEKNRLDATLLERMIRYAIQQRQIEAELETRVRERTEELNRANEQLREMNHRKDEFLATLAHELRNPLAPIRNALEILRMMENDPEAIAATRSLMERQVGHLVRLIDDLLEVSRISRGKLRLELERLELRDVVAAAVEQSQPLLDKAGQKLTVELPPEPIVLSGDRLRLAQVFTNILNNAAKYSEPGGVVALTIERGPDRVHVRIKDSGVGIPRELLPELFEPFSQVDRTLDRAQGGLGIGLNLVRRIVELHEGKVAANSGGLGHGAEFTVTIPCEPADALRS